MLLIVILFPSMVFNIIASLSDWKLCKRLIDNTGWKSIISPQYVFQYDNITLKECCYHCLGQQSCQTVFLYHDTCYGNNDLTPDASKFSEVNVFVKQPIDVCTNAEFVYFDQLCLHVSITSLMWLDAETYCQGKGGRFLVLDSKIKHNIVANFLNAYYQLTSRHYYVGASDIDVEGSWKWIDDNANNYFNFHPSQPNNIDSDFFGYAANCGAYDVASGLLVDDYCYKATPFICEI